MARLVRRLHHRRSNRKLSPPAILGICLGSAVLLALIIGNILNATLDDPPGEAEPPAENNTPLQEATAAPSVCAYPFSLNDPVNTLISEDGHAPGAVSVSINNPNGGVNYRSAVSQHLQLNSNINADLKTVMQDLKETVPYVCGVFYPAIPISDDADLLYAAAATDASLLREFIQAGGNEILLVGVSLEDEALPYLADYVKLLKTFLGDTPIGFTVPMELAASENGWEKLPLITSIADFIALDLQGVSDANMETTVSNSKYYTEQYGMRPLLSASQTNWISEAEASLPSYQIISVPTETQG